MLTPHYHYSTLSISFSTFLITAGFLDTTATISRRVFHHRHQRLRSCLFASIIGHRTIILSGFYLLLSPTIISIGLKPLLILIVGFLLYFSLCTVPIIIPHSSIDKAHSG
ncbi:hypothetical protein ACJW30_10G003000 [Castanea mollissima]